MTARVDAIIDRIGTSRRDIIPLLQALQDEFSYLPSDALLRVYERTEIDRAQLISVSTFYSQFRHVPYGKHIIKVCTGTACHVKGANNVYDAFRRELKMEEDRITTADQEYSIENYGSLGDFSDKKIVLNCYKCKMIIEGEGLLIEYFTDVDMKITGHIHSIHF